MYRHEQALKNVVNLYDMGEEYYKDYRTSFDHYILDMRKDTMEYPLVFIHGVNPYAQNFSMEEYEREWNPNLSTLRKDEYSSVLVKSELGIDFIAAFTTKSYTSIESKINICRTSFIVVVLGLASIYFTKDAQELVLDPLERMIEKVKLIAKNPLAAATDEVNEAGVMSFLSKQNDDAATAKERS